MTQQVDVPGVGIVEFPDSMSDDQVSNAIKYNIIPNYQEKTAPKQIPIDRTKSSLEQSLQENPIIQGLGAIGTGAGQTISNSIGGLIDLAGRGVGAINPSAGQAMQDFAAKNQAIAEQKNAPYKEQYPILNTTGQIGGYIAPFTGALKGVRMAGEALPMLGKIAGPATSLTRAGEAALAGGTTGALTTPGDVGQRAEQAGIQGAMAGAGQLALPYLAGVAKGAYNKYLGIEAPRMYNPNTGVPVDARGSNQYSQAITMPPEVQQAYPNAKSVPAPGTAGQQTGSRLYDYATSLRPWTDLIGGSTGMPLGGLVGEIPALSKVPGFKSQGLPEIGLKAIPEAFQSNKLQGLLYKPSNNLSGASASAPVAGPVAPTPTPAPINQQYPLTVQGPGQQLPPSVIPMKGPTRQVNIEGQSYTLPNQIDTSQVQTARPQPVAPQPMQPNTVPPAQAAQIAAANRIIGAPPIETPAVQMPTEVPTQAPVQQLPVTTTPIIKTAPSSVEDILAKTRPITSEENKASIKQARANDKAIAEGKTVTKEPIHPEVERIATEVKPLTQDYIKSLDLGNKTVEQKDAIKQSLITEESKLKSAISNNRITKALNNDEMEALLKRYHAVSNARDLIQNEQVSNNIKNSFEKNKALMAEKQVTKKNVPPNVSRMMTPEDTFKALKQDVPRSEMGATEGKIFDMTQAERDAYEKTLKDQLPKVKYEGDAKLIKNALKLIDKYRFK